MQEPSQLVLILIASFQLWSNIEISLRPASCFMHGMGFYNHWGLLIGWLGAGALYSRIGNGSAYRRGRNVSASIGLVPMHRGSGGKNKLGGISKCGDRYLRSLLVHGARSAVYHVGEKPDGLSCWIRKQLKHGHVNKTVVALANKLTRMAWAILNSGGQYQVPVAQAT